MRDSTVVFIQGGGSGAHVADGALVSSLERKLGIGYQVQYPTMPSEEDPDYRRWKPTIAEEVNGARGSLFLVAHSVGGPMLLRYLADELVPKIAGLFLIAPPYLGPGGWDFEGLNIGDVLSHTTFTSQVTRFTPVTLYHSRDDRTIPFAHQALYAQALPQAKLRKFYRRGHQFNNDLSMVARDVSRLAT